MREAIQGGEWNLALCGSGTSALLNDGQVARRAILNGLYSASNASMRRLVSMPPGAEKPVSLPVLPITRWQGTRTGQGLLPIAAPTAREAAGLPMALATWPYVMCAPLGMDAT